MRRISLPWGSVILEADSPRRYELFLESTEDSLRRSCYLRLDFDPGEWTVTLKPRESVVCTSCGGETAGIRSTGDRLCAQCGRREPALVARLRRGTADVSCQSRRIEPKRIVQLAGWARRPRPE